MSRAIEADYDQVWMFPPSLEELVPKDHPARFIRAFVEEAVSADLGLNCGSPDLRGQPHYGPRMLLGVWLYGYFQRIKSTRRLELGCRNDVGLMWLCGMHAPDHNTLWRFFDGNRATLRKVFKQTVRVAMKAQLMGFVLHALDGTKMQARVANRSGFHQQALEKQLAALDEVLDAYEQELTEAEACAPPRAEIPEHLQEAAQLRGTIQDALKQMALEDTKHLHPADPDARVMKCSDRNMNTFAYNNQVVVDEQSRLIVSERVTQEHTDARLLAEMTQQVEDECGQTAQTTVADAGYAASKPLHDAQEAGHHVLVNLPERLKANPDETLKAANFHYDSERNVVVCPLGEILPYTHTRWHKGKQQKLRVFRCHNKDCPLRGQCSNDPKGRKIELGEHHEALQAQRGLHEDPETPKALAQRRHIVEPVFAWIKQHLGMRRFTVDGLEGVRPQWSLACTTYNLTLLYQHWKTGQLPLKTSSTPIQI